MNPVLEPLDLGIEVEVAGGVGTEGLMAWYRALALASEQMLDAARQGDWEAVCRLEGASLVLVAQLKAAGRRQAMAAAQERERLRILQDIVVNDAEIRRIMAPQPAWLH